jgi:hypothetical protein
MPVLFKSGISRGRVCVQKWISMGEDRPEPELTLGRKELLRKALSYMCSICDGAFKRDGEGFNKPDARIGHWLNATGLEEDNETGFRVAEMVLSKYHRQLTGEFCEIWKPYIKCDKKQSQKRVLEWRAVDTMGIFER